MLKEAEKGVFEKLGLQFPAVAIKFHYSQPENVERIDKSLSFCQFVREAQDIGKPFFITKDDDACFGKMVLGMVDKPPLGASGQAGYDFGVFKTPAANARLYNMLPTLVRGAHNFVVFCPVSLCDFDPDLVIVVANTEQADIVMRATSYISGDLWESKTSNVLSCAWTYAYPYVSGKVNFCVTGMHHGMKRRKVYPAGLHIISIPYQKLLEVVTALDEMDWELIAMKEDEESKSALAAKMAKWQEMSPDFILKK
ncbi:MAG: hypothetical protein H6Q65_2569 [Firmicutes bacterium]|nr:hypothetical protein [Bacillota bacterium]